MDDPLNHLLAQLSGGDREAAGELFRAFEPYLRKAVRRHLPPRLRTRFDSADILQSVWADVFRAFRDAGRRFTDVDHLRGFLFVAMRNRLIDRVRQHRKAVDREEPLGDGDQQDSLPSSQPSPSAVAQAADLWGQLVARCPPEHRPLLTLKRQGYSLAEIGERTGLHPDSVRRILRDLARRLAFSQRLTSPDADP